MATENQALGHQQDQTLQELNERLAQLKAKSESLVVTDQRSYVEAGNLKLDIQAYLKAVKSRFVSIIEPLKERLARAQNEQKVFLAPGETILDGIERKRKAWAEEERRKAEAEQRRINQERRIAAERAAEQERKEREAAAEAARKAREKEIEAQKKAGELKTREAERLKKEAAELAERQKKEAAEEAARAATNVAEVKVAPSIPTVAGTVARRNWKWRWKPNGEQELMDQFCGDDGRMELRPFIQANDQEIGRMVRDAKDKAKAEGQCPGIEVWSE